MNEDHLQEFIENHVGPWIARFCALVLVAMLARIIIEGCIK